MVLVGADGMRGGWVAAAQRGADGPPVLHVFASLAALVAAWPGEELRVAIDVPIGLSEHGAPRTVDQAMRARLAGRASAVFNPPARFLLSVSAITGVDAQWAAVQELLAAHRAAWPDATVPGISRQALGILPKIAEVDRVLRERPALVEAVAECHPELSFVAMHGNRGLDGSKTSALGLLQRLALVQGAFPQAGRLIAGWPAAARMPLADVLDAFAALWTARRWAARTAEILGGDEDAEGLPMRCVV